MNISSCAQMSLNMWSSLHISLEAISEIGMHRIAYRNRQSSDCYKAIWVRGGRFEEKSDFYTIGAESGEWVFSRPGNYSRKRIPGTPTIEIAFYFRWQGQGHLVLPFRENLLKVPSNPRLEEETLRLSSIVRESLGKADYGMRLKETSLFAHVAIRRCFRLWFMEWVKALRNKGMDWFYVQNMDERVASAVRHMTMLPTDGTLSIHQLARDLNISEKHLTMLFLDEFGMAPKEYWMKLRLRVALDELRNRVESTEKVAARFGYSRQWFHSWIKRETGKTPAEIRAERDMEQPHALGILG